VQNFTFVSSFLYSTTEEIIYMTMDLPEQDLSTVV